MKMKENEEVENEILFQGGKMFILLCIGCRRGEMYESFAINFE